MAKKRRRVPEILWRLFHNRARTLADTILALLPSPAPAPAECPCKGRRCLGCSGDRAFSFLLKPKDPPDYRKLLSQCFVVVSDNAPPFSDFDPHRRWSQLEIVRRIIEMMICKQPTSRNVICNGYNKSSSLSPIVELLTSSAWSLLLKRVGDILMVYLLRNSSIFLPLPQRKHHQVAGFPISDLCPRFSRHLSSSEYQHPSQFYPGPGKKRKRVDEVDKTLSKLQSTNFSEVNFLSGSACCVPPSSQTSITPSGRGNNGNCSKKSSLEEAKKALGANCLSTEVCSFRKYQESSIQTSKMPKKRMRQNSWQRCRKRRHLSFQGTSSLTSCARSLSDKDNFCGEVQRGLNTTLSPCSRETICFCCSVFQTLPKVIRKAQIDRQTIFYKSKISSFIFPRKQCQQNLDILNALKPNTSGANVLFRDIFGASDALSAAQSMPCLHSNLCLNKSTCLYHSLIKQLKTLIRKARSCQHLRLLEKHCAILSLDRDTNNNLDLVEGGRSERNAGVKEYAGVQVSCNHLQEKFNGSDFSGCWRIPETGGYQFEASKSYCIKNQVVSFIWAVCRSIVPQDLLGSPYNWRILRKNISKFIRLRRFEKFSLKQCLHKIKITKFSLLSIKHSSCHMFNCEQRHMKCKLMECSEIASTDSVKHKILECWILWFFSRLVVPLLQANFYVTESEHGNQEVYYYQKYIWEKLVSDAFTSLEVRSLPKLDEAPLRKILNTRSFGFSRIRLRPKEKGFRLLANLKAPSRLPIKSSSNLRSTPSRKLPINPRNVKYAYFKAVNKVLCDVHAVLKGIQMKEPEKLGASVFDYNDVYKKFVPFLFLLKNGSSTLPGVFIIVSDVSKAFDSVDQNKLLSAMEEVISSDEYPLNDYLQVVCTRKSLLMRKNLTLTPQDNIHGCSEVAPFVPACAPHCILVKQDSSRKIKKEELFLNLNEHIKHNVLQLGDRFCLQKVGIPQGSVLSSLLCSFYYGHLERNIIFPYIEKAGDTASGHFSLVSNPCNALAAGIHHENESVMCTSNCLLLRFIDDYLIISTSRKQASLLFSRLQRGFRGYNCYMNESKFGLNFDLDHLSQFGSSRLCVGEDGISFLRWSGLLVNCSSLEIQADYTRYLNSHLTSSLTVNWHDHPARLLKLKLCDYLRPKCHPIFYDSNINSAGVVRLNIYQAFLVCAMKFHSYISCLNGTSKLAVEFFMDAVKISLRYMHKLIKRRMQGLRLGSDFRPIYEVRKGEIEWLGLTAYTRVLKRKQSRYRELLSLLRTKLMEHREAKSISTALDYAVDDAHSSLVWKIKY